MLKTIAIIVTNAGLIGLFLYLARKKNLLSYLDNGKWWLTWLSIAIITLMDELTSVFYTAAESYMIVGLAAFVFIALTSLLMRLLSNRMVEIAHVLEHHNIRGGGVYSFSYLVLGPSVSFVAVASILVDYILTAAISTVSAVYNGASFFHLSPIILYALMFLVIWGVAGLNILGVRENARFTYLIFIVAALVLMTLIVSAFTDPSPNQMENVKQGFVLTYHGLFQNGVFGGAGFFIFGVASVILAYSGIESVVQTAGLVKSWKEIRKAYMFLALTVGVVTPVIVALVLTRTDIDFKAHETDLITHFATVLNGKMFGGIVAALASFTLIMAVNTAFVASSELLERVAHRYGFHWLIKTNKGASLYRIHIINAALFTFIIAITAGSQEMLAHMYAVGLVASFTINMGSLVYYRYSKGSEEIPDYHTSRTVTLFIFIVLLSCFIFIAYHKWQGFVLWLITASAFMIVGIRVAKRRAPEILQKLLSDSPMGILFQLSEVEDGEIHIFFKRPSDKRPVLARADHVYVTYYNPRAGSPDKLGENHYRFAVQRDSLSTRMLALIEMLKYDFGDRNITFHLGWPTSSWIDRLSTGVMVYAIMRLPKHYPNYNFSMEYWKPDSLEIRA